MVVPSDERRIVHEHEQRERPGRDLGHVEELRAALAAQRRRVARDRVLERAVQLTGRDLERLLVVELQRLGERPVEPLPRDGAGAQEHGLGHEGEAPLQLAGELGFAIGVRDAVPLVQEEHEGSAAVEREPRELRVLLRHSDGGVEHEQRHVTAFERAQRHQRAAALDAVGALAAAAQARGVDEDHLAPVDAEARVGRVARGAGLVGHDVPLLAKPGVEQGRLAHVRASDDREPRRAARAFLGRIPGPSRQVLGERELEVGDAARVRRAGRHDRAEAELVELGGLGSRSWACPPCSRPRPRACRPCATARQFAGRAAGARRARRPRTRSRSPRDTTSPTWRRMAAGMPASASGSSPPVSTSSAGLRSISVVTATRSRVTPGRSSTRERPSRRSRLKSVDFPTFARPTIATSGGPDLSLLFTSEPLLAGLLRPGLTLLAVLGEARRDSGSGRFGEGPEMTRNSREITVRAVLLALLLVSLRRRRAARAHTPTRRSSAAPPRTWCSRLSTPCSAPSSQARTSTTV